MDNERKKKWQREYYQKHLKNNDEYKQRKATYIRELRIKKRHPCQTCGILIDYRSKFCHKHAVKKAERHYNWKGGTTKCRGYILVFKPDHPRAVGRGGYVREHFLVWEQGHGKSIPEGWVIHHINGIKSDNRLCNLVAMPNKKHNKLIEIQQKRIQELEALLNGQKQLL